MNRMEIELNFKTRFSFLCAVFGEMLIMCFSGVAIDLLQQQTKFLPVRHVRVVAYFQCCVTLKLLANGKNVKSH